MQHIHPSAIDVIRRNLSYDTGDKVIQCGRHNDIFKFWLAWRGKGSQGFEYQMDRIMELTQYQLRRMQVTAFSPVDK